MLLKIIKLNQFKSDKNLVFVNVNIGVKILFQFIKNPLLILFIKKFLNH